MRITLLTNYDAASSLALRYLLPALGQHTLTVFYTDKPAPINPAPNALKELSEFERALAGLDTPFSASKAEVLNHINQAEGMQRFIESEPDLVISIRHMSILKEPVIAVPKHGIINLHSGLLPEYRGVMATFWAMKNGEKEIGTTLHTIDDSTIDTGQVIAKSSVPVDYEKSYLWNTLNVYRSGCANIVNTVQLIAREQTLHVSKQLGAGNYFSFPTQKDIKTCLFSMFGTNENFSVFVTKQCTQT